MGNGSQHREGRKPSSARNARFCGLDETNTGTDGDLMQLAPRLSKSRYIIGLQCSKRLWLGWHNPEPRSEPEPGTILAIGTDVGVAARLLVPGGVLVEEGPHRHPEAVERTRHLIADPTVPAIFEAAFAFDCVLMRADILERLPSGAWCLAEVRSTTRVKPEHLHDLP